jgi:hypothetical protein
MLIKERSRKGRQKGNNKKTLPGHLFTVKKPGNLSPLTIDEKKDHG